MRSIVEPVGRIAAMALVMLAACTSTPVADPAAVTDDDVARLLAASFRPQGAATLDRLQQDESDAACSRARGQPLPAPLAERLQAEALKTVRPPSDGRYLGDWRAGEKLAQSGRGMTWADAPPQPGQPNPNGGGCYNCHQIGPAEVAYGTLGPSLYRYGRLRGITGPAGGPTSEAARPIVEYTWGKLWNAKAFNACSGMPRFGHKGLLDEAQLKDLMALLLDPASPVNR